MPAKTAFRNQQQRRVHMVVLYHCKIVAIYVEQQTSEVVITIPSYVLQDINLIDNVIGEQANERPTSSRP